MPRTRGIPAYGLHKPTGQARVRIDGQDVYLGPHGSEESRRKYEQIVRKLITDRAAVEIRVRVEIASDLTISELVAAYVQYAKTYYVKDGRQTTEYGDIARTVRPIREQYGNELVTAFGPLKLKAIRDQWIAAGLVRSQINAKVGRVRRMFAWGVEQELGTTRPWPTGAGSWRSSGTRPVGRSSLAWMTDTPATTPAATRTSGGLAGSRLTGPGPPRKTPSGAASEGDRG